MPGQRADFFQHGPLLSNDNALVAGLFAVDGGPHVHNAGVPFGKFRDFHGGAVGDLLVQAEEQLLPQQLSHDLPLRLVGGLPVGEELGPLLGIFPQLRHQLLQAVAGAGGNGDDGVEAVPGLAVGGDDGEELRGLHGVDFVDGQDAVESFLPYPVNEGLFRPAHMGDGLHQEQGAVHVGEAGGDDLDHVVPQGGLGPVEARGVQEDELGVLPVDHAVDAVPGGLGLVGDDGDFLPHQGVGQAGLAHVGPSADGDHGGFLNVHR